MEKATVDKTEIRIGSDYMDFVCKLHDTMLEQEIVLVYEGEVNQSITKAFTSMTEKNMEESEEQTKTAKRVYHVMVECLQNIFKHTDDVETGQANMPGSGIFLVTATKGSYIVTTGNIISNDRIPATKGMIDEFNSLDESEIKQRYKTLMKESRLSEKAGAGLGFIDIIKKTKNPLEYHFEPVNERASFFIQKSTITREK